MLRLAGRFNNLQLIRTNNQLVRRRSLQFTSINANSFNAAAVHMQRHMNTVPSAHTRSFARAISFPVRTSIRLVNFTPDPQSKGRHRTNLNRRQRPSHSQVPLRTFRQTYHSRSPIVSRVSILFSNGATRRAAILRNTRRSPFERIHETRANGQLINGVSRPKVELRGAKSRISYNQFSQAIQTSSKGSLALVRIRESLISNIRPLRKLIRLTRTRRRQHIGSNLTISFKVFDRVVHIVRTFIISVSTNRNICNKGCNLKVNRNSSTFPNRRTLKARRSSGRRRRTVRRSTHIKDRARRLKHSSRRCKTGRHTRQEIRAAGRSSNRSRGQRIQIRSHQVGMHMLIHRRQANRAYRGHNGHVHRHLVNADTSKRHLQDLTVQSRNLRRTPRVDNSSARSSSRHSGRRSRIGRVRRLLHMRHSTRRLQRQGTLGTGEPLNRQLNRTGSHRRRHACTSNNSNSVVTKGPPCKRNRRQNSGHHSRAYNKRHRRRKPVHLHNRGHKNVNARNRQSYRTRGHLTYKTKGRHRSRNNSNVSNSLDTRTKRVIVRRRQNKCRYRSTSRVAPPERHSHPTTSRRHTNRQLKFSVNLQPGRALQLRSRSSSRHTRNSRIVYAISRRESTRHFRRARRGATSRNSQSKT